MKLVLRYFFYWFGMSAFDETVAVDGERWEIAEGRKTGKEVGMAESVKEQALVAAVRTKNKGMGQNGSGRRSLPSDL